MPCMPSVSCRLWTMDDDDGRCGSDLTRLGSRRPVGIGKTAAAQRHLFCPALRGSEPRDSHLGVANTTHGARAGCIVRRAGWLSQLQAIFAAAKQPLVRCQGCSGGAHRRTHCSHFLLVGWLTATAGSLIIQARNHLQRLRARGHSPTAASRCPSSPTGHLPGSNTRPPRDDLCLFGPPRPWPAASGRRSLQACCFSVCLSVSYILGTSRGTHAPGQPRGRPRRDHGALGELPVWAVPAPVTNCMI